MGRFVRLFALTLCLAVLGAAPSRAADELALKRVLLSTGGVGYFEYEATVTGDADLSLEVRLDQVDDVLKSVVVYDDVGTVGTISLPGKQPLEEIFRELPFSRAALESPVALLAGLRGAVVEVSGARKLKGRIISVRPETTALAGDKGVVTRHRLSLMTEDGVRQLILEDTDALKFADPKLQRDVDRALAALAELGVRDRRTLKVRIAGEGTRTVRVAYVVEAPLWKTSYRLTMPDDPLATSADIQGWAVVENLSGKNWNGVELAIVSGNPVTFRQALYNAYYVNRPEVPVDVLGRVMPRADEGAVASGAAEEAEADDGARKRASALRKRRTGVMSMAPASGGSRAGEKAADARPDLARVTASESTEATSYVLFRHPTPVTVANGYSVVIPIVSRALDAERLALYQPETHATHPLATIALKNGSDTALPPGILTLYERGGKGAVAFVGDARMKTLPAGETRLLSYALDQNMKVDRENRSSNRVTTAKIAGGYLVLTARQRRETLYRIAAPARQARRLVLEHPRIGGWDLVEPSAAEAKLTPRHYRISRKLEAGETVKLTVALERTELQRLALATMHPNQVRYYAQARELRPAQRKAFAGLAERLKRIEDAEARVSGHQRTLNELFSDQDRLRKNLQSVPRDSDLFKRYLAQMQADEDAIEAGQAALKASQKAVADARQAMLDYARGLEL